MPATRFILIRHGETEWNAAGREMGQLDSPLTPLGVQQAQCLAARLSTWPLDQIYSSDLPRAARTAAILAEKHGLAVKSDVRLRERHMGIFQGFTPAESEVRFPAERAAYRAAGADYIIPSGESARQRTERTVACLEDLAAKHGGQSVLVVTHGGILLGFFEHVLGLASRSTPAFRRPNAALNVFWYDGGSWKLETWGDVSHLESLVKPKPAT